MTDSDLNKTEQKIDELGDRLAKVEENVKLLTHIFEEVIKQFDLIQKEISKEHKKK